MVNARKSANKSLVRRVNIALILHYLRTTHYRTRAALASHTGLTRATISSLVDELITLNMVRETGLELSKGGRPGTGLELNPAGGGAIGLEIGVGFVSAVLTDFAANIQWRDRVEFTSHDSKEVIAIAEHLVEQARQRSKVLGLKLLGIGLGLPGLVKADDGLLKIAPNLGWHDIPFRVLLNKRFRVPVYAINEGSAAALGEHYFGVAADYLDFVYLSASSVGIGGGVMIGGTLFQGVDGYAGEFGHIVIDPLGAPCACGRHGCWEKVAGSQSIVKYVVDQIRGGQPTRALELAGGNIQKLTTAVISQAAGEGDTISCDAFAYVCRLFGVGVMNLINTFNPQLVVIGGSLSRYIEPFLPIIEEVINQQSFRALTDNVVIKVSRLGEDACLLGAVAAVMDVVFADPTQQFQRK